jgi:hypothetical protein
LKYRAIHKKVCGLLIFYISLKSPNKIRFTLLNL